MFLFFERLTGSLVWRHDGDDVQKMRIVVYKYLFCQLTFLANFRYIPVYVMYLIKNDEVGNV